MLVDYYRRQYVRRAILDFVHAGSSLPIRECAFYNRRVKGLQRYMTSPSSHRKHPMVFDSDASFETALRSGATAFYCSYWRYTQPGELAGPIGRDLVWTVRAKSGGLQFAKQVTISSLHVLEDEGFYHPWVKYSGTLGFDIIVPFENLSDGVPTDPSSLDEAQKMLTRGMADYLARGGHGVNLDGSKVTIKSGLDTCLLSELWWSRGLLLAPMSLHPNSGLVSVPLEPENIRDFSVLEASPENVPTYRWNFTRKAREGLTPAVEWQSTAYSSPALV
ncbi:MAG: hypothetical protein U9M97_05045 [Candidatus Hadarchaeota archaeon]|nr:hypothetical protein [Candidatus Hadarchaeota archaeon]